MRNICDLDCMNGTCNGAVNAATGTNTIELKIRTVDAAGVKVTLNDGTTKTITPFRSDGTFIFVSVPFEYYCKQGTMKVQTLFNDGTLGRTFIFETFADLAETSEVAVVYANGKYNVRVAVGDKIIADDIEDGAITLDKLDQDVVEELNKGADALTAANGKNSAFYQGTAPDVKGRVKNDIWFDTANDNKMYYFDGSKWVEKPLGVKALTVGELSALSANLGRVTAGTIEGVEIIGSKFIVTRKRILNVTQEDKDLLRNYLENNATLTEEQIARLDVDQDGKLSALDYLLIEKISSGKISNEFTDTITIYNDGSSKITLKTTNGTQTYETVISTGGINTKNIYADNVDVGVLNVESWIEFGENTIGTSTLTDVNGEHEIFSLWFPNLPLDIYAKTMLFNGTPLIVTYGDTWNSGEVAVSGYVTSDRRILCFSIPVGRTMVNVGSVRCTSLKMNIRTIGGNFVGEGHASGGYEYVGHPNYTILAIPMPNNNTILINMEQTVAYGTTDDTPISVSIKESTFEFY